MSRLLGAVLSGGRSSRFGSDKAMATWQGRTLIDHAIDTLRPIVPVVVVVGRRHGDMPDIADRPEPGMGPLGGLNAALHHAAAHGFDAVLSVGCDTPRIPAGLLDRLLRARGPAFVADLPVIGIWPVGLASGLDAFLGEPRKHAVRVWASSVGAVAIDWPMIANINRVEDLDGLA